MICCILDRENSRFTVHIRWPTRRGKVLGMQLNYDHAPVRDCNLAGLLHYIIELVQGEMKKSRSTHKFTAEERWVIEQRLSRFASLPLRKPEAKP